MCISNPHTVLSEATLALVRSIPYSVDSTVGLEHTSRLETIVRDYTSRLVATFPAEAIEKALKQQFREDDEALEEEVSLATLAVLTAWQRSATELLDLQALIEAELTLSGGAGFQGALEHAAAQLGIPLIPAVGVVDDVLQFATEQGGALIRGIDQTTRDIINKIIAKGLEEQKDIPGIVRELQRVLPEELFPRHRLEAIARTETNRAMSHGAFQANLGIGADTKEWITVGDDRVSQLICAVNEAGLRVSIHHVYVTFGGLFPPGHPNCRCVVVYFGATRQNVQDFIDDQLPDAA